jgi:hypothetical protein
MVLSILLLDVSLLGVYLSQDVDASLWHIQDSVIEFYTFFRRLNTDVIWLQFQIVARLGVLAFNQLLQFYFDI